LAHLQWLARQAQAINDLESLLGVPAETFTQNRRTMK